MVPAPLRKARPVSVGAQIQNSEEQKTSHSRPNSSALEGLASSGLQLPTQLTPEASKRDSVCSGISTSESIECRGSSLSADLALNRETGSLSIKVTAWGVGVCGRMISLEGMMIWGCQFAVAQASIPSKLCLAVPFQYGVLGKWLKEVDFRLGLLGSKLDS